MKKTSGFALTSLVLGILDFGILAMRNSLFLSWYLLFILFFILAVSAIVFGVVGIHQTGENSNRGGRDLAITGLCLGIVEIVLTIVLIIGLNTL